MESMIDFLRFRLFEREDFIALSTVDVQGRFQAAMLSPPGGDCQYFLIHLIVWQAGHHHRQERISFVTRICAALPQHMAVRLCLTGAVFFETREALPPLVFVEAQPLR